MKFIRCSLASGAIFLVMHCSCIATAAEQEGAPLSPDALVDLELPGSARLSPDGRFLAFVVQTPRADYAFDGNRFTIDQVKTSLRVIDVASGETIKIGSLDRDSSLPAWSPDGRQLAFQSGAGDEANLWVWSTTSREARQISDLVPRRFPREILWTPDGRQLLVATLPEGVTNESMKEGTQEANLDKGKGYPLESRVSGARVAVYRAHGDTSVDEGPQSGWLMTYSGDLALVEVDSGRYRRLTTGLRPASYRLSPDGRTVMLTHVIGGQDRSFYRVLFDVVVVPLKSGEPRVVARHIAQWGWAMDATWSPDSAWLAFFDSADRTKRKSYLVNIITGERRTRLLEDVATGSGSRPPLWDRGGKKLYAATTDGIWEASAVDLASRKILAPSGKEIRHLLTSANDGTVVKSIAGSLIAATRDSTSKAEGFHALDTSNGISLRLMEEPVRLGVDYGAVSADGLSVTYVEQRVDACPQLWVSDLNWNRPRKVSDFNPDLRQYRMGNSQVIRWRSTSGGELQGALLLPAGYQPGQRYPLVVNIYGDMRMSNNVNVFGLTETPVRLIAYENKQLLAARGYVVLQPDTETRLGTPMADIAGSLMPAVDKLIDDGIVDSERLGIMGHSYGGYSVLSVLVQSTRFKAALVSAGFASTIGAFSEMPPTGTHWKISWTEESQGKMGGSLWDYRERYIENSPLFYFDRVTTPVLVVHGTEDTAVYVHQGDEIFQALRRLGKTVEYAKYLGEPHVISSRENSIDRGQRMIEWFDRYLKAEN